MSVHGAGAKGRHGYRTKGRANRAFHLSERGHGPIMSVHLSRGNDANRQQRTNGHPGATKEGGTKVEIQTQHLQQGRFARRLRRLKPRNYLVRKAVEVPRRGNLVTFESQ